MNHSCIEALETRIAPANLGVTSVFVDASDLSVSLSGGLLKIGPKAGVTELHVSVELLPDGTFLLSDGNGDSDIEEVADFTGLVRSVQVNLTTGDDSAYLTLDSDYTLGGNVSVNTSTGDDRVEYAEGNLRGSMTVTGKGANDVLISGGKIRGLLTTSAAGGTFTLGNNASVGALSASGSSDFVVEGIVIGDANLSAKAGVASFQVGGVAAPSAAIGGNLNIKGGANSDDVYLGNVLVRGAFSANLGEGANDTTIASLASILGTTRINGGTGDDTVLLGGVGNSGPSLFGRISLSLGNGANGFNGLSALLAGGITYGGGTGVDTVALGADLTMYGDAKINTKDGANVVSVATFSSLWKFALNTGVDADTVTLAASGAGYVAGSVKLGGGTDSLTFSGNADFFSTFKVDGGLGTDTVTVAQLLVDGGLLTTNVETVSII